MFVLTCLVLMGLVGVFVCLYEVPRDTDTLSQYKDVLSSSEFEEFKSLYRGGNEHTREVIRALSTLSMNEINSDVYLKNMYESPEIARYVSKLRSG